MYGGPSGVASIVTIELSMSGAASSPAGPESAGVVVKKQVPVRHSWPVGHVAPGPHGAPSCSVGW
jgi:hypothetical protein